MSTPTDPGRVPDPDPRARAAGWYPDPARPGQQIYWTGDRWTRGQLPLARRRAAALGARFRSAALASQALLVLQGLSSAAFGVLFLRAVGGLGEGASDPAATDALGRMLTLWILSGSLLLLATAVTWFVWQVTLATSDVIHVGDLRRSVGWHVASWIVPVVSLWFPLQNVADLDAAARAPRDALGNRLGGVGIGPNSVRPAPAGLLWAWWLVFLLALLLERMATAGLGSFAGAAQLRSAVTLCGYAALVETVAAGLALLVVRRISASALLADAQARTSQSPGTRRSRPDRDRPTAAPSEPLSAGDAAPDGTTAGPQDPPLTRAEIRRRREGR